jgi:hypothetical protein
MSTGFVDINIYGMIIVGNFSNGKIVDGKMHVGNISYEGTFNDQGLLSGDHCSIQVDKIKVQGKFINGIFTSGVKLNSEGKIIEEGDFICVSSNKLPRLIHGTKYIDEYKYEGSFDKYEELTEGTMTIDKSIYTGHFVGGKLIKGKVSHIIGEKIFSAEYAIEKDIPFGFDLFTKCHVKWNGTIEELPMKLIIMLCCDGEYSKTAHKFYIKYLSHFDGNAIRYLSPKMFTSLDPESQAGLSIIIDNLKKYEDYKVIDLCKPNKLRRVVSACELGNLVDKHYSPREYFTKDH